MAHDDDKVRELLLPGWLDSDALHWQSRWEALHGACRVVQDDWVWPRRGDWMARLDEVVLASDRPVLLVAHSLGCHLVAAWAAHSTHAGRCRGALLVAPPDAEREDMPPNIYNWRPMVRQKLPFPSLLALSQDDPYCALPRGEQFGTDWGSSLYDLGPCGHVNAASGLGEWPQGRALLACVQRLSPTIGGW